MREWQEKRMVTQDKPLETDFLNRSKICARYQSTIILSRAHRVAMPGSNFKNFNYVCGVSGSVAEWLVAPCTAKA